MNYGIPYKGSKNLIGEKLLQFLPSADTFVDLFCGGCSMTHAAIMSGRYKRFVVNDISPMGPTLFVDALSGKFHEVASFAHRSRNSSTKNKSVIEKLFCTKRVVQKTKLITDELW